MELILVNLGIFQEYILHTISQAWLMGNRNITVLCENEHRDRLVDFCEMSSILLNIVDLTEFKQNSKMERYCLSRYYDPGFRHNFWNYAWQRFIMIYAYIKTNNIRDIVHIENDISVYVCFDDFLPKWREKKMWLAIDSDKRCVPSVVYIRDAVAMEDLLFKADNMGENDMVILGKMYFKNKDDIGRFPLSPEQTDDCVFDAAAIGQYLGGVDPRNTSESDTRGYISPDCDIKYNAYDFEWHRGDDRLWRPFLRNKSTSGWFMIANLHIHSKKLMDFSSIWPLERKLIPMTGMENQIIQGETIQRLCPIYIGHQEDFQMNPLIRDESSKHMDLLTFVPKRIWNPPLVFVYTIRLQEFLVRVLPFFVNRCVVVCHNSDFIINDDFIESVQSFLTSKLIRICTQNLRSLRDTHFWKPLPIGIQNTQWLTSPLSSIQHQSSPKTGWIYMNFGLHTNPVERRKCLSALQHKIEWTQFKTPHADYWRSLSSFHYCICPVGNGVDTHRLWEALIVGTCPIVVNDLFYDRLFIEFPCLHQNMIVLDSWHDLLPITFHNVSLHLDMNRLLQLI